jgi:hypothetical protein
MLLHIRLLTFIVLVSVIIVVVVVVFVVIFVVIVVVSYVVCDLINEDLLTNKKNKNFFFSFSRK